MRKIFLLSALSFLVSFSLLAQDDKDNRPTIEPSGNIITKEVSVTSFDQLDVSGVFNLMLTQGNKEEVKIEADDNLQSLFEVKNEGSKLTIGMKKDINMKGKLKLKVYITFKNLKSMDLKTVGNVSSEANMSFDDIGINNKSVGNIDLKLTTQKLNMQNKSVGNVKLSGKADNVTINNKGVGSIQAANFVVQKMDIENSGIGSAEVNAEKELKVKDSFMGKVTNKGAATTKRMNKVVI
ncbi:MAG: head GIN domain-containing protein [Bacteroidota bacterium]